MSDSEIVMMIKEIIDDVPDIECPDTEFSCGWKSAIHSIQHVLGVTNL